MVEKIQILIASEPPAIVKLVLHVGVSVQLCSICNILKGSLAFVVAAAGESKIERSMGENVQ